MQSEKLNKYRELADKVSIERAVGDNRVRRETNETVGPNGQANDERPTELARVRRSDVEAKDEDEVADNTQRGKPTKLADRRNLNRVDKVDKVDRSLLSKYYLLESIDKFLPKVVPSQDQTTVLTHQLG